MSPTNHPKRRPSELRGASTRSSHDSIFRTHRLRFCLAVSLCISKPGCAPDQPHDRLLDAAAAGDLDRVETLLAQGFPPELPDQEWTPLQAAAYQGHAQVVRALVAAGARLDPDVEDTPLMLAAWRGHVAIARFLLEAGAEIESPQPYQVLQEVAAHGHLSILEMLIGRGADVNQRFRDGWTALMTATAWNHPDMVRALIAEGADVDVTSDGGLTALTLATRRNQVEIVDALLAAGADPDLPALAGRPALMWASYGGRHVGLPGILCPPLREQPSLAAGSAQRGPEVDP